MTMPMPRSAVLAACAAIRMALRMAGAAKETGGDALLVGEHKIAQFVDDREAHLVAALLGVAPGEDAVATEQDAIDAGNDARRR